MKISVEHFDGKYPSFNVSLASEGKEPFLTIKGCRIADGSKGKFVSWPARKQDDGKWWNHVYASDAFNAAVLEEAMKTMPRQPVGGKGAQGKVYQTRDDVPF